jgi:hypothetical protein
MDNSESLNEFYDINKEQLMSYDDVNYKMSKFSFSCPFYYHRKILPQYIDENNFLFGFEFGVCVLKDKLLYLGDKLWIHEDFKYLQNFKIDFNQKKIFRDKHQIKVNDENQLKIFNSLLEILSPIEVVDENKLDIGEIKNFIYQSNDNLSSFKYYFEKINFKTPEGEFITLTKDKYFKEKFNQTSYFFLINGVYFTNDKLIYVYYNNNLSDISHLICEYDDSCEILINFIKTSIPKGIELKINIELGKWDRLYKFIFDDFIENCLKVRLEKYQDIEILNEEKRLKNLNQNKLNFINQLDLDNNGEVDLVDGETFNKLLTKNQKSIIEIDKNYIKNFVKISMYLKTKKSNTQKIFDSIKDSTNEDVLTELVNLLKNQIHTYELLVFHSINMITSLVESDLITFYEIYECFDQFGVFNSNWENEVSNKLTDIGDGIKELMYSIDKMENNIVNSIDNLTYVTQDSFRELNISVNNQLSSIDSSIKFNNLLTGIQTYQMYKINQNTKRIE